MSKLLKVTLIVQIVLAVLFGLPLLAMPGRFLGLVGWAPVEPLLCRMFGAALLGFGWLNFRTLWGRDRQAALPLIEASLVFNGLTTLGMLWNMRGAGWPWYVWTVLGLYIAMTALWAWNWQKK